jgi:hypothetical protein
MAKMVALLVIVGTFLPFLSEATTTNTACAYGGYASSSTSSCSLTDAVASCTYLQNHASQVCRSSSAMLGASCKVSQSPSCSYSTGVTQGNAYCCSVENYVNYNGVIYSTIDQSTGAYTETVKGYRCTSTPTVLPNGYELARDTANSQNAIAAYPFGTQMLVTATGNAYYAQSSFGLAAANMLVTSGSYYSVSSCNATIFVQKTMNVDYGLTYSTLLGVDYQGTGVYGQTDATAMPTGWALAPFSETTLNLVCQHPWSTQYMIFANGWYVTTNTSVNTGSICRITIASNTFTSAAAGYTPSVSNAQMLIYMVPTSQPTTRPSSKPSGQPTAQPSRRPSRQPTGQPTRQPTAQPTRQPVSRPTGQPSRQPTTQPTMQPTRRPTSQPSRQPTSQPTGQPSRQPTSQPSRQPTRQPTAQPTRSPSGQPTGQPTRQPTSQPSRQPTLRPSMRPSSQPTVQPSSRPSPGPTSEPSSLPSMQPSCQPTRAPSAQPTRQPISRPTGQPSRQPTSQPSRQPTRQPTSQPTRLPSMQPTAQPTRQPTSQPTRQPTRQPTGQPTRAPTSQPTRQPTTRPTTQPSLQPTNRPTSQPTRQPSSQPSAQPASHPSAQPTRKPTMQPSAQPSCQPSGQPTDQPSKHPTAQPSRQPTSQPSSQPSRQPFGAPTGRPSIYISPIVSTTNWNYANTSMYEEFTARVHSYGTQLSRHKDSLRAFSQFSYPVNYSDSRCSDWNNFTSNNLQLPAPNMWYSSVSLVTKVYDFKSKSLTGNRGYSCSDPDIIQNIVLGLVYSTPLSAVCQGHTWTIKPCAYGPSLCVDCAPVHDEHCIVGDACPSALNIFPISPCNKCAYNASRISFYHWLQLNVSTASRAAPQFRGPLVVVDQSRYELHVNVSLSKPGTVYCNALVTNSSSQLYFDSLTTILAAGFKRAVYSSGSTASVTVVNLMAATNYTVYCYAEAVDGSSMNITQVKRAAVTAVTRCCRQLVLVDPPTEIEVFSNMSSISADDLPVLTLAVDSHSSNEALEDAVLSVVCNVTVLDGVDASAVPNNQCRSTPSTVLSSAVLVPTAFSFNSFAKESTFIMQAAASGCYRIDCFPNTTANVVNSLSELYAPVSTVVSVRSRLSSPVAPVLNEAAFSVGGDKLSFHFDADSDRGIAYFGSIRSSFSCGELFMFTSSADWICSWSTDSVVTGYYNPSAKQDLHAPTSMPTGQPSRQPSLQPSGTPTAPPTGSPTCHPSSEPTSVVVLSSPTVSPTRCPTLVPTVIPTRVPSSAPTMIPSAKPSAGPTKTPTVSPSVCPSISPTNPTTSPSSSTTEPSVRPTHAPTTTATQYPSPIPSARPTPYISIFTSSLPRVGDIIVVNPGRVQAKACSSVHNQYTSCGFNSVQIKNLSAPLGAAKPSIILSAPALIGFCSDLLIDPTASAGHGGRAWDALEWTVSFANVQNISSPRAADTTTLAQYLYSEYNTTTEVVSFPNEWMAFGVYEFTLKVTNFLGQTSSARVSVMKRPIIVPVLSILGDVGSVSITRADLVTIYTQLKVPSVNCAEMQTYLGVTDDTDGDLDDAQIKATYEWMIFSLYEDDENITVTDVSAQYAGTMLTVGSFTIAPYVVTSAMRYFISVRVKPSTSSSYLLDNVRIVSTLSTIEVAVRPAGLYAAIYGGSVRYVSVKDYSLLNLDASGSRDLDYPAEDGVDGLTSLQFHWHCIIIQPTVSYGASCLEYFNLVNSSNVVLGAASAHRGITATSASSTPETATIRASVVISSLKSYYSSVSTSTSAEIHLISNSAPLIYLSADTASPKISFDTKIIVTGYIAVTGLGAEYQITANWAVPELAGKTLKSVALSPVTQTLEATDVTTTYILAQLAIAAGSFDPDVKYTFQLRARYTSSLLSNGTEAEFVTASCTVIINGPPHGGELFVRPSQGRAIFTIFNLSTRYWADDVEDYPLHYAFTAQALPSPETTLIKPADPVQSFSTVLGRGYETMANRVIISVIAGDVYDCKSQVDENITVNSALGDDGGYEQGVQQNLTAWVSDRMSEYINQVQVDSINQLLNAVIDEVNTVVCPQTSPMNSTLNFDVSASACKELNRHPCWSVGYSCGICLDGFYGDIGESRGKCVPESEFLALAADPSVFGNKPCPSNCSYSEGRGECSFYSSAAPDTRLSSCSAVDATTCFSHCLCTDGWFGLDCSLTQPEYADRVTNKALLANYIADLAAMQAVSRESLLMQSRLISSLLQNPTEIESATIELLSSTLLNSVFQGVPLLSSGDVVRSCVGALSAVLEFITLPVTQNVTQPSSESFSPLLVTNLTTALTLMAQGMSLGLSVGEEATSVVSSNIRISSALLSPASVAVVNGTDGSNISLNTSGLMYSFAAPQTAQERLLNITQSTVNMNLSSWLAGPVSGSITQFMRNPHQNNLSTGEDSHGTADAEFIGLGLELFTLAGSAPGTTSSDTTVGTSTRRRRQLSGATAVWPGEGSSVQTLRDQALSNGPSEDTVVSDTIDIMVTMKNLQLTDYNISLFATPYNGTVTCRRTFGQLPYHVNISCLGNQTLVYRCSGKRDHEFQYQCPGLGRLPSCSIYDDASSVYVLDPACVLVSFTSESTTCKCTRSIVSVASESYSKYDIQFSSFKSARMVSSNDISAAAAISTQTQSQLPSGTRSSSLSLHLQEFNAIGTSVITNFAETLENIVQINLNSIQRNILLFSILIVLLVLCTVGLVFMIGVDWKEKQQKTGSSARSKSHDKYGPAADSMDIKTQAAIQTSTPDSKRLQKMSFADLLIKSVPYDLRSTTSWYRRFWHSLKVNHDLIGLVSGYSNEGDYRTIRWIRFVLMILCYFFVNAILSVNYFESAACAEFDTAAGCLSLVSIDQVSHRCRWIFDDDMMVDPSDGQEITSGQCELDTTVSKSPLETVVLTIVSTLIAVPLHVLIVIMIIQARYVFSVCTARHHRQDKAEEQRRVKAMLRAGQPITAAAVAAPAWCGDVLPYSDLRQEQRDFQFQMVIQSPDTKLNLLDEWNYILRKRDVPQMQPSSAVDTKLRPPTFYHPQLLLIAARLNRLSESLDGVSVHEEADAIAFYLRTQVDVRKVCVRVGVKPSLAQHQNRQSAQHQDRLQAFCTSAVQQSVFRAVTKLTTSSKLYSHVIPAMTPRRKIRGKLTRTRYHASLLKQQLELIADKSSTSEKGHIHQEVYLLRQFILHLLNVRGKNVAGRFFTVFLKEEADGYTPLGGALCSGWVPYAMSVLLPCLLLFMILYIFLFGVRLGPGPTKQWLLSCCLSWIHSMLFLRPLAIWTRTYLLTSCIRGDIHEILQILALRAEHILLRRGGIVTRAQSLLQSFNPACRVARMFPSLSVSRLLICLSDFDFPQLIEYTSVTSPSSTFAAAAARVSASNVQEVRAMFVQLTFLAFFIVIGLLPEQIQDVVLDGVTSTMMNALLLGFAIFGSKMLLYCIFTIFVLVSAVLVFCCLTVQTKKVMPLFFDANELPSEDEEQEAAAMAVRVRRDNLLQRQSVDGSRAVPSPASTVAVPVSEERKDDSDADDDGDEYEEEDDDYGHEYPYKYTTEIGILV